MKDEKTEDLFPAENADDSGQAEEVQILEEEEEDFIQDISDADRIIRAVGNDCIPMLILNERMIIVYCSKAARDLFEGYYYLTERPFFNVFHSSPTRETFRTIATSLNSPEKGYTWSGSLAHKAPGLRTLRTKTTFLPLFGQEKKTVFFVVLFEITDARNFFDSGKILTSLLKAVELKDNDTGAHNNRVSYYSQRIAQQLFAEKTRPQVDMDFIDNITLFAAMHDVGKIGTPDSILLKAGKLTTMEWDIMKEHTINGAFILSGFPVPMAKEIALSHHEWWDGSGYPYKLSGEMIPLPARIVAIADVYDAIRMRRTYKAAFSHEEAVKIILDHQGTHFDPDLVRVFASIQDEFRDIWEEHKDEETSVSSILEVQNAARNIFLAHPQNADN